MAPASARYHGCMACTVTQSTRCCGSPFRRATAPSSGSVLPAGDITIDATASDADGSIATVEFWDSFNYLGEDTTQPYSFVWTAVTDGCYEIVARVIDNLGGVETDAVQITVGTGCG
jgi:hypothetical protein